MTTHPGDLDLTARQPSPGGGMDMRRLFPCGHKATTSGAQYHRGMGMYLRCAACAAARKATA